MSVLPVALQLYTVRDFMEKDLPATLAKVREIGYECVEPAGLFGLTGEQFRAELDKVGLKAICAHVPFAEMTSTREPFSMGASGVMEVISASYTQGCPERREFSAFFVTVNLGKFLSVFI